MNNKAQTSFIVFMVAITLIILGLAFAGPLNQMVGLAMNSSTEVGGMNCSSTTDNFVKVSCWTIDIGQAYFIGGIFAFAGAIIAAKLIIS